MDFLINFIIEVAFLSLLATLYYYYQKRKLNRYTPEEKLLIDLHSLHNLVEHKIQTTEHDEDLIQFNQAVLTQMEKPDLEEVKKLIKKFMGKVKDKDVLDFLADFEAYLNEEN